MRRRTQMVAAMLLSRVLTVSGRAEARSRPLFEPTDLEMEDAGTVELDLQLGAVRGPGAWRAVLPDFELDLGVLPGLELNIDGAYAIEGPPDGPFSFDHSAPDSLWLSAKIGLLDRRDPETRRAWAAGVQLGPKLPVASGSRGVGFESLLLIGRAIAGLHVVLNLGTFVDPAPAVGAARPVGIEAGLDLDLDLDDVDRFSLIGELGGVLFLSSDPHQLLATAGVAWALTDTFEVSLAALCGFLDGNDRYGLLLGLSPKLHVLRHGPER